MAQEDDTEGKPHRRKKAGLGPTTLDLNATEIAGESQASVGEDPLGAPAPGSASPIANATPMKERAAAVEDPAPKPWETSTGEASASKPVTSEASATEGPASDTPPPRLDVFDQPPQRSTMPVLLAAVVGGLVGGALVLAAGALNLVPLGGKTTGDDTLAPRITAAEQDIASIKAGIDKTNAKINGVDATAKSAQEAAQNALSLAGEAQKAMSTVSSANEAPAAPATVPDLTGITDRLTKAETDVSALNDAMRQVGTATSSLSQQITSLKASVANTPDKAAAYAVALSELGEAIQSGKPFAAELNTAKSLGDQSDALAALASLAQTGVPSLETLAASYDAVKPQIVAALTPKPAEPPADASVLDRLTSSIGGIVTTTPEGAVPEGDPAWPAQKVADALHRGDLPGAITAFKAMPEAGQKAGASWLSQASGAATALDLIKAQTSAALQKFTGQ